MIRFAYAAMIAGAAAIAASSGAPAADREFCQYYTYSALVQVHEVLSHRRCAERIDPGPRWSTDSVVHFDWCRSVSRDTADGERAVRTRFIQRCRHDW